MTLKGHHLQILNQYQPSCLEAKLTSAVEIGSMTMTEETKHDMEEDFEILLLEYCI